MPNHQLHHNQDSYKDNEQLILALDYGVKKTGMAVGNTVSQNARPFDILPMDNGQPNWDTLLQLIETWKFQKIVIGLPLNMDGSDSMIAKRASKFARRLAHKLMEEKNPARIYLHDERLSSREARELAWENGWIKNERDPIDDVSACILLNSYLEDMNLAKDVTAYQIPNK